MKDAKEMTPLSIPADTQARLDPSFETSGGPSQSIPFKVELVIRSIHLELLSNSNKTHRPKETISMTRQTDRQ